MGSHQLLLRQVRDDCPELRGLLRVCQGLRQDWPPRRGWPGAHWQVEGELCRSAHDAPRELPEARTQAHEHRLVRGCACLLVHPDRLDLGEQPVVHQEVVQGAGAVDASGCAKGVVGRDHAPLEQPGPRRGLHLRRLHVPVCCYHPVGAQPAGDLRNVPDEVDVSMAPSLGVP